MKLLKLSIALTGLALAQTLLLVAPAMSQEALKPISPKFTPDPQVYVGKSGGDIPLASIATSKANGQCQGLTQQTPNHSLTVQKDFGFLALKVSGDQNLSLLVKGPDGIYCRSGGSPELSGAWVAGNYEIWISTPDGDRASYRLTISETSQ
ncbi:alpha-mannosidase [Pseudanabaena sp. lw0831]|uniref:hypothetical protein n=1 Tax=Pseudanabaena sp. lw0831 TaxID=1357935 RepID=UPI0019168072|nr:hypothetical protein [Pseudanabaena sp. lw0831]GBO56606.1 alpha-mannosidase [Pseudanabaena sp. lw0831]